MIAEQCSRTGCNHSLGERIFKTIPYGKMMTTKDDRIRTTEELGELLRVHRKSRDMSQVDAAALAGVGERLVVRHFGRDLGTITRTSSGTLSFEFAASWLASV